MNIHFDIYGLITTTVKSLPYVSEGIPAGFPSPAADYIGDRIDLNEVLILSPGATYYARVRDYYLVEEELEQGDGILKVLDHDINRLGVVLDEMAAIAGDTVKVTVTVSADEAALPHDVKKYL